MTNQPTMRKLQIEIALTINAMEVFVKASYNLEGDGALALSAYEEICKLVALVSAKLSLLLQNSFLRETVLKKTSCLHTTFCRLVYKYLTPHHPAPR